ncbi:MAG TPA: hypothetical protein VNI52_03220 [Sphingobacteriaceae bacterium]|nr:hypothetical protein [Sphingobacteriaceae bacterium]
MRNLFFAGLVIVAVLQSCSNEVYNNESYIRTSSLRGKKVAILPVEVEFTGRLPKGYTLETKRVTEDKESTEIQNMVYREYLFRAKRANKNQQSVEIINIDQVNSRLRAHGINPRKSWTMNPDSLGKLVGADMVMRVRVKKDRIMSTAASIGVGVATTVLENILNRNGSGNSTSIGSGGRTYNIFFDATLSDVNSSTVISKISKDGDASWSETPEEVIKGSSGKMVRRGAVHAQY